MMRVASCSRRHFEREEADDAAVLGLERAVGLLRRLVGVRDVERDVGGERGLAHAGTSREHDQVGGLQAAHAAVEVAHAGRDARQMPVAHEGGVRHVDGGLDRIGEALEAAVVAAGFGEFEQPPLGVLDLVGRAHVDRRVIGDVDHVLANGDQRAARREVVDGAAIIGGVDDGDGFRREAREIVGDRHVADLLVGRQERLDGHRIGHLAHADEFGRNLEDLAVERLVEMRRLQEIGDTVKGVVVDEDGAEQRLLRLDVVRRLAVERCFRHAEFSRCLCHCLPDPCPIPAVSESAAGNILFDRRVSRSPRGPQAQRLKFRIRLTSNRTKEVTRQFRTKQEQKSRVTQRTWQVNFRGVSG